MLHTLSLRDDFRLFQRCISLGTGPSFAGRGIFCFLANRVRP